MGKTHGGKRRLFYGYTVLIIVWISYFLVMGFPTYGGSVLNSFRVTECGYKASVLGAAVALNTLMQGLCGPFVGRWAKRGIRAPYLIGTVIVIALAFVLGTIPGNQASFIFLFGICMGIGMGFAGILTAQCAVNNWFYKKKSFAMAVTLSAGAVGGFIAPQTVRKVAATGGWQSGWLMIAGICVVSLVLILVFLKNQPSDVGQYPDGADQDVEKESGKTASISFGQALRERSIYLILLNYAARTALYYAFTGHSILYITANGFDYAGAVTVISILSVTSLAGRLLAGVIPERWIPPKYLLGLATLIMTGGVFVISTMAGMLIIYAGTALFGLGFGITHVIQPIVEARLYGSENFSVIHGSIQPVNYVIGAFGPFLVGVFADRSGSYAVPFLVLGVMNLIGGICAFLIRNPDQGRTKVESISANAKEMRKEAL